MYLDKILVVDDEEYILHILDFTLGGDGFKVVTANTGEYGIEKAKQEKPNLIVLDVQMPGLDGYETCQRLKQDPETKNIPVLLFMISPSDHEKQRGFDVGAIDCIIKPFSPARLSERIMEVLSLRK